MRMRNAAVVLAACVVALGGLLFLGVVPAWLGRWTGVNAGGGQTIGLAVAAIGLFQLGRRRSRVRFVTD